MEIDKPIAIAVILFLVLVLSIYLVLPKYEQFQELLIKMGQKQAEFEGKDAYFIEVVNAYKTLILYQDSLDKIETALPEKTSLAALINFLRVKTLENGLVLQNIGISKTADSNLVAGIKETTLSVSLIGSYKPFENFLSSLEKSSRLIESGSFSFNVILPPKGSKQTQQTYPISLTIKVYSY